MLYHIALVIFFTFDVICEQNKTQNNINTIHSNKEEGEDFLQNNIHNFIKRKKERKKERKKKQKKYCLNLYDDEVKQFYIFFFINFKIYNNIKRNKARILQNGEEFHRHNKK